MAELETVLLRYLLADEKAIAVGVMYPGEDTPSGVPLIRVADIVDGRISSAVGYRISEAVNSEYRRTQLSGDEVLMTLVGRPGVAIKVPTAMKGWNAARALAVLRLADPDERDFFVYSIASPQVQHTIRNWCNTTVQATLNLKEIKALPLPWPDRTCRRAIAATLGALDDKIELNRQMNETLEAMARALFRDWFVDFGPTRAKMEGRPAYLSEDLWSLFPDRLDEEGKPEGWNCFKLEQIAQYHTKTTSPEGMAQLEVEHFSLPAFDKGQIPAIDHGTTIKSNKTLVPKEAVLLSKLNPEIPRIWMPEAPDQRLQVCSTEFLAFTAKGEASRCLLFCLFSDERFREMLQGMVTGTSKSHQRISPPSLLNREVVVGKPETFSVFEQQVSPLLERVRSNRAQSRTLAQTRDLLLPRLMSRHQRARNRV